MEIKGGHSILLLGLLNLLVLKLLFKFVPIEVTKGLLEEVFLLERVSKTFDKHHIVRLEGLPE